MLRKLVKINVFKFIYYNFLSKKIIRKGKGYIIPYWNAVIDLAKDTVVEIYDENFYVNFHKPKHSRAEAYLKILQGGKLIVRGRTCLYYQSTIEIHKNAVVDIGGAIINSGAVILAAEKITIGKECLISRQTFIYDSDHHKILDDDGKQVNPAKEVGIGDHVWIGLKCTILRGTRIGEGAMIAANSLVGGKVKPGLMAQGNPARGYSTVKWER